MKKEKRFFEFNIKKYDESKSFFVYRPSSLSYPQSNSVMFVMEKYISLSDALLTVGECLVFWPKGYDISDEIREKHVIIQSDYPRKEYIKFFRDNGIDYYPQKESYKIVDGAYISEKAIMGEDCTIMPGAYIGGEVTLGNKVYIGCGARLVGKVTVGDGVVVRENTVIGADGLTTEKDTDGTPLTMPQFGGVEICDGAQIGANTVIARGAIDDTVIGEGSKIDSSCFISHNVTIGENVLVVGESLLMGSSKVGNNSFIAGNVVVRNKVSVGEDALVGMGGVVTRDVSDGAIVMGNPAKEKKPTKHKKQMNEEYKYTPSYDEYKKIIDVVKKSGKLKDYREAMDSDEFIVLRHDVEFSLERAYKMAQIEQAGGVSSSYFVQITNHAYNALSMQNRRVIQKIYEMGHMIGLHYHLNCITDPLKTRDGIRDQIRIMSEMCGIPVDRFSIHRPVREVYYNTIPIDGIINAYSPEFFTLLDEDKPVEEQVLEVKYIADSRHRWNYGYPDERTIKENRKIQLLIHPDFWSEEGYDAEGNFGLLIKENVLTYIETLDGECKHFSEYKDGYKGIYE